MTQEEIIELKKFCIEQAAKAGSNGADLANTAAYLFDWIMQKESLQLNRNVESNLR